MSAPFDAPQGAPCVSRGAPLLDTHAWIWWMQADARLGKPAIAALDAFGADDRPSVSAICLWEVAMLVNLGRLDLGESLRSWLDAAADPRTVRLLPITPAIANEVGRIPDGVHRDPADRLIIATARVHDLPVLTRDKAIRRSKLVTMWSRTGEGGRAVKRAGLRSRSRRAPAHPDLRR